MPVARHAAADDFAFQHAEGGEQGGGAVALVIVGHGRALAPLRPDVAIDNGSSPDPRRPGSRPAARSSRTASEGERRPRVGRQALPFFSQKLFQRRRIQHRVRQQPLQLGVLVLERLEPLRLRHVEAPVLGLLIVQRRLRHPILPAEVRTFRTGLLLTQNADDLLFRKTSTLHRLNLRRRSDPKSRWMKFRGQVSCGTSGVPGGRVLSRNRPSSEEQRLLQVPTFERQ